MVNSCVHQMSGATGSTKCWSVEVEQLLEGLCVISIDGQLKISHGTDVKDSRHIHWIIVFYDNNHKQNNIFY